MCCKIRNEGYDGLVGSGAGMYCRGYRILCFREKKQKKKYEIRFLHGYFAKNKV